MEQFFRIHSSSEVNNVVVLKGPKLILTEQNALVKSIFKGLSFLKKYITN